MPKKVYDIAVKTGEYQDSQGNTKGRYQNVGAVIKGDNGPYIIMERWFNPAGVPNPDSRSNLVLSLFEPRQSDQQPQQQAAQQNRPPVSQQQGYSQPAPQVAGAGNGPSSPEWDDDIPFTPYHKHLLI